MILVLMVCQCNVYVIPKSIVSKDLGYKTGHPRAEHGRGRGSRPPCRRTGSSSCAAHGWQSTRLPPCWARRRSRPGEARPGPTTMSQDSASLGCNTWVVVGEAPPNYLLRLYLHSRVDCALIRRRGSCITTAKVKPSGCQARQVIGRSSHPDVKHDKSSGDQAIWMSSTTSHPEIKPSRCQTRQVIGRSRIYRTRNVDNGGDE